MSGMGKIMDYPKRIYWNEIGEENKKQTGHKCPYDRWEWVEDKERSMRGHNDKTLQYQQSCYSLMNRKEYLEESYITFLNGINYYPRLVESLENEMREIGAIMKARRENCPFVQSIFEEMERSENRWEVNKEKIKQRKQENLAK